MPSLVQLMRTRIDRLATRYHDRASIVASPAGDTITVRPALSRRGASIEVTIDDDTQVQMDIGRAAHFELYESANKEALADEVEAWIVAVVEFGARERIWARRNRPIKSELRIRMPDGSNQRVVYSEGVFAGLRADETDTTIHEPYQTI